MHQIARAAIGTIQPDADGQTIALAFLSCLRQRELQLQHFRSSACFSPLDSGRVATGRQSRHLDSWLMSPGICREVFVRGAGCADLTVVDGAFAAQHGKESGCGAHAGQADHSHRAMSRLDDLCQWLNLPRILALDVPALSRCLLPTRPNADGILLDRVPNRAEFCRLKTVLESVWGIPVVGALGEVPECRAALRRACCQGTNADAVVELGRQFAEYARVDALLRICKQAAPVEAEKVLFNPSPCWSGLRVAVAYDDAFNCYFADVLDLVESRGAEVVDFSLLKDERVPDAEIVFIGCGHPEHFAARLAANQCMLLSLREHVCEGGRLYAEGGGLAYLCQFLETPDGEQFRMCGMFPAAAFLNRAASAPEAVEASLAETCWLGQQGTRLRGYLNPVWDIRPLSQMAPRLIEKPRQHDLLQHRGAFGSRIHIDLALQPDGMRSLVQYQM